ncbi:MAG: glutathione S-transferase N-terminal domain-containing protein [Rhodobacterales bacterium]|jgi:GST-like protein|tara:strand:- start:1043 stop:1672 length:630 start_codon:yes stop_codon:yes gene_type:complete
MIDFYTWGTPNGRKVSILLEELKLDYQVVPINISNKEQFTEEFLTLSPNNKIPAIYDHDTGISLMESGAIMIYLAEKANQLLSKDLRKRIKVIEWLMWQKAGFGPMLGQAHHFLHYNKGKAPYAEERYRSEANRLYSILNKQLSKSPFVVEDYSIADIAIWPWVSRYEWQEINLSEFPNVRSWYKRILAREPVQKGYHIPTQLSDIPIG